jgi:hypothetical protein
MMAIAIIFFCLLYHVTNVYTNVNVKYFLIYLTNQGVDA